MNPALKHVAPPTSRGIFLLLVAILGWLWFVLLDHLHVEWTVNPQYGYGWAVLFLCAFLVWKNFNPESRNQNPAVRGFDLPASVCFFSFALLALLYPPTRLLQDANPEWRLVSWALATEVVGLTLLLVYFVFGAHGLQRLAFPILFFLVAVPWPTLVEGPLIQGLTRADAGATVELLGWLGIPAMPHGNVIEVATGEVGIDDACSGIRSFQATLMISLFLGEFYRLTFPRRLILVLGGFAMSFAFNLARMSVLVWVAAHHGIKAIAQWHDPTGVTILLACFFALWLLGLFLARKKTSAQSSFTAAPAGFPQSKRRLLPLLLTLGLWLVLGEISVEGWYRWHEWRLPPATQWTLAWPTNNPTFKTVTLPERTMQILRYDEGRSVAWSADGLDWQAVFLRWKPGRTALHLAQNHTPEACLTATGNRLTAISDLQWLAVRGLRLPFRVYEVMNAPRPLFVFYCLWDDRANARNFNALFLTYGNRLTPVRQGLRNPGQRSLEMAVSGAADAAAAELAVRAELEKIIMLVK